MVLQRFVSWTLLFLAAAAPLSLIAQLAPVSEEGDRDPAFDAVPFDKWLDANAAPQIKWDVRVNSAELSMEQRLRVRVDIQVDGDEVAKRRGRGQLVTLVRLQDSEGRAYESHNVLDLKGVQQATNKLNFVISQSAFVLPGDYQISLGVLDTATGEHSVGRRSLHVNPIKNDPLPIAWRKLPPVEIVSNRPFLMRKINLQFASKHPVRVEVLANMSPSLEVPAPRAVPVPPELVLNGLASVLRVLSEAEVPNGTFHVKTLNLTRRKVLVEQEIRTLDRELDWEKLSDALRKTDPNVIDVDSLRNRGHSVEFFCKQVRIGTGDGDAPDPSRPQRVLIVLSPPFAFGPGEDARPMELETPGDPRIYYLRRHTLPPDRRFDETFDDRRFSRSRRLDPSVPRPVNYAEPIDSLDRILKHLKPRTFDIYTAEDLRKALAAIADEISRL